MSDKAARADLIFAALREALAGLEAEGFSKAELADGVVSFGVALSIAAQGFQPTARFLALTAERLSTPSPQVHMN